MATLIHETSTTTTNFATAFGLLPRFEITVSRGQRGPDGQLLTEIHTVRIFSEIIPTGATTPLRQANITDKLESLIALTQSEGTRDARVSLTYTDNGAVEAWSYDGSAQIDFVTRHGLKCIDYELPASPADYVTHKQYSLTFQAEVSVCSNSPIAGVASYVESVTEVWDHSGLISVTYQGELCKCEDVGDVRQLFDIIRDTRITDDARDRFTAQGSVLGSGFGPLSQTIVESLDKVCIQWSLTYGGGDAPPGLDAHKLLVTAERVIQDNRIRLTVTGVYFYKGNPPSIGGGVFSGGVIPPFSSGGSTFTSVKKEAEEHKGIDKSNYYPSQGYGACYLDEVEELRFDGANHTITATRTYWIIWRHDDNVSDYHETVQIQHSRQGISGTRQTYKRGEPANEPPLCKVQTSGLSLHMITYQVTMETLTKYYTIPDRIPLDDTNVWRIEPDTLSGESEPAPVHAGPAVITPGGAVSRYRTQITITYAVRDLNAATLFGNLPVNSVHNVTARSGKVITGAGILYGGRGGFAP